MTEQALSVWTRQKRGREQPALSREQIVAEAIKLLDADGLDTLSMRNLGKQLGAGATSLYRHVANKDELIELVVDEIYGEIEVPEAGAASWRASTTVCASSVRAMILRHPWVASVLGQIGTSYLGPNVMRLSDRMLALFEEGGFGLEEANLGLSTVLSYVIGWGINEAAWMTSLARSGLTEREWSARMEPAAREAARSYPRLNRLYEMAALTSGEETRQDEFTYGLDRILDGLEKRP
ncbi:AcrR family transcriptional regulator [Kibdelosporangium banguiense]|uniref:AcrR family transcriptional regulator n=1 Tax=Kibdelosporangium banguiense TaxID=1365924 RepID=A0ABS4TI03_9PSEU|nr:TetR/AcrR family transcriptional regulator [Kibdelosporangium banguiense]MBP2324057.1 AcrR family transcriptional regulator [Kibdelosporangium banguiense]